MIISGGLILLPLSELWTHNFSIFTIWCPSLVAVFTIWCPSLVAVEQIEAHKDDDSHRHHEDDEQYVEIVEEGGGVWWSGSHIVC